MSKSNKFGFEPLPEDLPSAKSNRRPGPMGAAVREAAQSLTETSEAKVEQRKANATDAKAYRAAQAEGRVLVSLPLGDVHDDDLPRDRIDLEDVAMSEEMEELKASIEARGQKEPIEVYEGPDGRYQIKKGWRRHTALTLLLRDTGDERFATVIARVAPDGEDHLARYVDMVEENVIREDLSFAEMAQVAITASKDERLGGASVEDLVANFYGSLHKMKRSYIRAFVTLMQEVGDDLPWPKQVARNLGVDVVRQIKAGGDVARLRGALRQAGTLEAQTKALQGFLQAPAQDKPKAAGKEKFEFHVGASKVTARNGECRILSGVDFTGVSRERLAKAVKAFDEIVEKG